MLLSFNSSIFFQAIKYFLLKFRCNFHRRILEIHLNHEAIICLNKYLMSKKIVNIQIKCWMKFKISIFKQYKQGKVQEAFRNHHKYFIFQSMITRSLLLVLLFSILAQSSIYDYSKCTSSQILNSKTLTCESCPANKESNRNQLVANECICKKGFYPASNSVCTEFYPSSSTSLCSSEQFINAFESTGAVKSVTGCSTCDSNAYQNTNGTSCTPCMTGMSYNSTNKKCQCINSTYTQTSLGCFPESYTASLGLTLSSSVYSARLKYLVPGCFYFKSPLSCSQLVNLCIYSLLSSSPECDFFTKAGMTSYIYSETTNVYSMAATSKDTEIKMKLISFTPEGNYAKEKDFRLADVMRCGLPSNADITVTIGSNIQVTCQFNFNNLLAQIAGKTYQNYLYQLLVQGQNGAYFEVNAYLNGNVQPVKRFFLEDTFTSTTSITVLTSFKFEMTLTTDNFLSKPSLYLTYTKLSLEPTTGITPATQQKQAISYTIQFSSQLSSFWSVILPIFIVVNVLVIVHAAIKTYIEYLNRKTAFLFFLHFIDIWSLWMFYFLLLTTAYWFIFLKTTPNIYIFAPNQTTLYAAFYIVFGLMVAFRLISVLIEKAEKLKIQIFLINWEKEKAVNNSWREIFIVNSLAEFCTYRTFSVFWLLLVMLFFMIGLKWEQHAGEVVHTKLDQIEYFHKKNPVLLYFLSSSILLVIAIAFKILRRLTVLFWPYPFEDFVDYCSVTNISFFFMKKRSPETFYIHADLLQKTEVTFKELNNAVRSGLKKDRSLTNQINNRTKIYVTYVNRDLEEKFAQMLKKEEDHDSQRHLKYSVGSTVSLKPSMGSSKDPFSYRQEFIEKRLKPAIQQIRNKARSTKTIFQSFFHIPPEDLRNDRGLNENQVFLDENLDVVKQVFPNGDEFEELHTIIIIYLLWIIVTGSSPIAAFLTYFCDEWILNAWVASTYRKNLERMTRVREGFML